MKACNFVNVCVAHTRSFRSWLSVPSLRPLRTLKKHNADNMTDDQSVNQLMWYISWVFLTLSPGDPGGPSCPEAPYENISKRENTEGINSVKVYASISNDWWGVSIGSQQSQLTFSPDFPVGPLAPLAPRAPCQRRNMSKNKIWLWPWTFTDLRQKVCFKPVPSSISSKPLHRWMFRHWLGYWFNECRDLVVRVCGLVNERQTECLY